MNELKKAKGIDDKPSAFFIHFRWVRY